MRGRLASFGPTAAAALAVAACALLAYSNATPAVAIHDDAFFVPARHTLSSESVVQVFTEDMWSSTGSPAGVYRPLVLLSLAADRARHGNDASGYHATNVLLHTVASLAVFALLLSLAGGGATGVAAASSDPGTTATANVANAGRHGVATTAVIACALAAALFAVHPVHTEVVDSVYNRSEMMATTFVAAGLLALQRWRCRRPALAWTLAAVAYFVALLCRESAVSMPVLAALLLWFDDGDHAPEGGGEVPRWRERVARLAPLAVFALPLAEYFVLRSFALSSTVRSDAPLLGVDAAPDVASRLLYSLAALREYARMMVWPWPLRVSYEDFAGTGLASALAVHAALAGTAFALRRRAPLVALAIAWFYATLVPSTRLFTSSGITLKIGDFVLLSPQTGLVLVAERVAYLPSVALAIAAAAVLRETATRAGLAAAVAAAAAPLVTGAAVTHARNEQWHSADALFAADVAAAPDNGDAWRLHVSALTSAGRLDEAAAACDEQAGREGRSAQLFNNCGVVYDRLGRTDDAMRAYRRTIDAGLAPVGHANLGRILARVGRVEEAEAEFVAAAEAETNPARRHYRTGTMLMRFHPGRAADARREFEKALEIQPDYVAAREALNQLPR